MRKILPIVAVLLLAPVLSGCNTIQDALSYAVSVIGKARGAAEEVREGIRAGCSALGVAEAQAAAVSPSCQSKVSRLKAGVTAICQNQALLADNVIGNYFSTVANAVKQAQASCQ